MEFEYSPSLDDPLFRPIYLHKIDPKFTDVEEFECSVSEVFKKMKEFEIDLNYVRTETIRIRKYVKTTSRFSAPTSGGRDVYRCRHYQKGCTTNEKVIRVGDRSETHCSASLIGGGKFVVKSFSDLYKAYIVNHRIAGSRKDSCECPACNNSGSWCKHLFAVEKWWKIYLTLRRDETDIDVPGLGFERETNSTTDNGIDVDESNVVIFDDTTTISPSESTNFHTPAEDACQNEVSELDEPEIMLGNGPVDNHYRKYDVFEEHDWVRITNNPQSGNSEPALVDIDRQNLIRRDIAKQISVYTVRPSIQSGKKQ